MYKAKFFQASATLTAIGALLFSPPAMGVNHPGGVNFQNDGDAEVKLHIKITAVGPEKTTASGNFYVSHTLASDTITLPPNGRVTSLQLSHDDLKKIHAAEHPAGNGAWLHWKLENPTAEQGLTEAHIPLRKGTNPNEWTETFDNDSFSASK